MAKDYRWVDDDWRRDWLFWVALVLATANLVASLTLGRDDAWWEHPLRFLISFGFTVAVLGFFRTVVRTYRAPDDDQPRP